MRDYTNKPFGAGARIRGWLDGDAYTARVLDVLPSHPGCTGHKHITVVRESDGLVMETFSGTVTVLDPYHPVSHPPKIRFEPADGGSSPIEATVRSDGRLRIETDPDSLRSNGTWLTPAEVRSFAIELLGMADAGEKISGI